jgi:hypothetical protein
VICALKNQDSSSVPPNFALLDATLPDVARLVTAMVQARDAVERRSCEHPQEPTGEEWWADVLADPRGRKRERRTDLGVSHAAVGITAHAMQSMAIKGFIVHDRVPSRTADALRSLRSSGMRG